VGRLFDDELALHCGFEMTGMQAVEVDLASLGEQPIGVKPIINPMDPA